MAQACGAATSGVWPCAGEGRAERPAAAPVPPEALKPSFQPSDSLMTLHFGFSR
jgi:hypothetical protein